jgi:hypothetical protein
VGEGNRQIQIINNFFLGATKGSCDMCMGEAYPN